MIFTWIERAVEGKRRFCPELLLDFAQHRPAGEAEINIESRQLRCGYIVCTSLLPEVGDRDRRIDVVKGFRASSAVEQLVDGDYSIRKV